MDCPGRGVPCLPFLHSHTAFAEEPLGVRMPGRVPDGRLRPDNRDQPHREAKPGPEPAPFLPFLYRRDAAPADAFPAHAEKAELLHARGTASDFPGPAGGQEQSCRGQGAQLAEAHIRAGIAEFKNQRRRHRNGEKARADEDAGAPKTGKAEQLRLQPVPVGGHNLILPKAATQQQRACGTIRSCRGCSWSTPSI